MKKFTEFTNELISEKLITFGGRAYPKFGQVVILAGGAGCYPAGTEYFDGSGWKAIDLYDGGDVLQYNPSTNQSTLVQPDQFVKLPVDQFYRIKNRGVDFTTSESHKHLLINEKTGKQETSTTLDLYNKHNKLVRGNKKSLVTSFEYDGIGLNLTDEQIRLKVAVYADGHMLETKEPKVRVSLKKERKVEAFKELLLINEIEHREYEENGFTRFEFKYDSKDKEFESYWYNCSNEQLKVVCDEVLKWDGCILEREGRKVNKSFSSTSKKTTEFIQFAFSATGHDVSVYVDTRECRPDCYDLRISHSGAVGISKNDRTKTTTEIEKVDSVDGLMYCFSVPTGFFVVRQNGKVFVSGNSGKGFVLEKLLGIEGSVLDVDALKKLVMGSKEMSKRIKDETGQDIKNFDLKKSENVSKLHELLSDVYGITKANERRIFTGALAAPADRKPNIIFDVTLKDMGKLEKLTRNALELGYQKENIHLVWVINDVAIAMEQNAGRDRVVPEEILLATHEGASLTMRKVVDTDSKISRYLDGDIWFSFNKVGVDTELSKSKQGGSYISDANYIQIKKKGQKPMNLLDIGDRLLLKIQFYTPQTKAWN